LFFVFCFLFFVFCFLFFVLFVLFLNCGDVAEKEPRHSFELVKYLFVSQELHVLPKNPGLQGHWPVFGSQTFDSLPMSHSHTRDKKEG